ncbi:MAG: hypothetical protein QGF59_21355, partial [Pirellulaceae bacterium]|nr:hypothetical protein [Pirellulaceae bacterium]
MKPLFQTWSGYFKRLLMLESKQYKTRRTPVIGVNLSPRGLQLESLEERVVLTTTMYLDFGGGIGMGSTMSTTVGDFRNIFGAGNPAGGANGTGSDLTPDLDLTDSFDFTPLAYDFNGDMVTNNADITALANAVIPIVQRALEPFDINVLVATAGSLANAVTTVGLNSGDLTGEFDAYNFIMDITSDGFAGGSVGDFAVNTDGDRGDNAGLFGIAAADDLFAQAGNDQDEATLTFSDTVFNSVSGVPGTPAFNQNLAHRLAYTATHEAFHTFTYVHTTDAGGANNGDRLMTSGDVIRLGSVTREDPFFVTRFD